MNCALTCDRYAVVLRSLSIFVLLLGSVLLAGCQSAPVAPPPPPLPKLLAAVQAGDVAQVKQLVAAGEKVDQYAQGKSSLSIAVTRCDIEMTKLLFSLGGTTNKHVDYAVARDAIEKCNNLVLLDLLASHGADLNIRGLKWNGEDVNLLGFAVANGQMDIAKLLLAKGAKVNEDCNYDFCKGRNTPLHLAVLTANADMAQFLISHGAKLQATASSGRTPLHEAAMTANVEMARLLVHAGASTVWLDENQLMPIIHLAMESREGRVTDAQVVEFIKIIVAGGGTASVKYVSPIGPALRFIPDRMKEARQLLISLGSSEADVARFQKQEAERWEKIVAQQEQKRIAKEKAAAEAEAEVPSISSDSKGGCTCTRRAQRWVSGRSGSGMVRGSSGHYEFYDEQVPCACK